MLKIHLSWSSYITVTNCYSLLLLCTRRLCSCKLLDLLKHFLHSEHLYGLSPVWTLMCLFRSPDWLNAFSHTWHLYLPLWIFICVYRPFWDEKHFSHWVHEYKFSPVCFFLWRVNLSFLVNRLSHTVHEYGLGLSSCGCSVKHVSSVQYTQHKQ